MSNNKIIIQGRKQNYNVSLINHAFAGCDRHLFGLQITAREQGLPVPELFTDPAYTKRFVRSIETKLFMNCLAE